MYSLRGIWLLSRIRLESVESSFKTRAVRTASYRATPIRWCTSAKREVISGGPLSPESDWLGQPRVIVDEKLRFHLQPGQATFTIQKSGSRKLNLTASRIRKHCPWGVHAGLGQTHQELQPGRYALSGSGSHPAELRADAAPGRVVAPDANHRHRGEADLLLGIR
jgi:hypothetical protein